MKRSLENCNQPRKKSCGNLISTITSIESENEYRERLNKMCQIAADPSNLSRDIRICTILRCMQLVVDRTSFWCGLPYELIEYVYQLCKHTKTKTQYTVSQHDMFGRLRGEQQISFPYYARTLRNEPVFETEILYKFKRSSNNESLRAQVKHVGLMIVSLFFYDTHGYKFGFNFFKSPINYEYYYLLYTTCEPEVVYGFRTDAYIRSDPERIPTHQNHYSKNLAMFEKFPKLHFSKSEEVSDEHTWLFTQPNELERVFDLVVESLRETFEMFKYFSYA